MRIFKALTLLLPVLLMACVYRPEIKQGNFMTDDMIAKIKPGMTETQVEYVLGPPMVQDPFHPDRWDYVTYFNPNNGYPVTSKHVVVMFKSGKVVSVEQEPIKPQGG